MSMSASTPISPMGDIVLPKPESTGSHRHPDCLPRLLGHPLRFSCWNRDDKVVEAKAPTLKSTTSGSALGGVSIPCKDLRSALQTFEKSGLTSMRLAEAGGGAPKGEKLWGTACDLVRALLLGVEEHLPDLRPEIDLREHSPDAPGVEMVSLAVNFGAQAVIGEVATPSRCGFEVRMSGSVRFSLQRPAPSKTSSQPQLTLRVHGLDFDSLLECHAVFKSLEKDLRENGGLSKESAYEWWTENKDTEYPLESSKFHRMVESLFGQRALQMMPKQIRIDSFWGFLHNPGCSIQSFTFHADSRSKTTLTARRNPAKSVEEAKLLETCLEVAQRVLKGNRSAGERFAASVTNFGAMLYGPDMGQSGADAAAIVKLCSAARWWGPGPDGWGKFDQTWGCKDKRNAFGIVVEEQGRLLWRFQSQADTLQAAKPRVHKVATSAATVASEVPMRRHGVLCCRKRAKQA